MAKNDVFVSNLSGFETNRPASSKGANSEYFDFLRPVANIGAVLVMLSFAALNQKKNYNLT